MNDDTTTKTRTKSSIDIENERLTITGASGIQAVYDLTKLPKNVVTYAKGRLVVQRLGRTATPQSAFDDLVNGIVPQEHTGDNRALTDTEQAIALAMRDEMATRDGVTKKSNKAAYEALLEAAIAKVRELPVEAKKTMKAHKAVVTYLASLKAAKAPQGSLLEVT